MIALSADRLGRRLGKAGVALDRLVKVLLGHTHVSTTQVYHEANERAGCGEGSPPHSDTCEFRVDETFLGLLLHVIDIPGIGRTFTPLPIAFAN